MRNLIIAGATMAAFVAGGTLMAGSAEATAGTFGGIRMAADSLGIIAKSQYIHMGRRHCWYADGWQGPGWYWCGYNWRHGLGWGGPAGWRGWVWREERREERRERRFDRRFDRY